MQYNHRVRGYLTTCQVIVYNPETKLLCLLLLMLALLELCS
jgi:hypothetical protein